MMKANYNADTGSILGFYPNEIEYAEVPEPCIEITQEQWQECINNQDKYIVDIEKQVLTDAPPPPPEPIESIQANKIIELKRIASETVLNKYPEYKQLNAALGIYGDEYKQSMVDYIQNIRRKVAEYEGAIKSLSYDELKIFEFKFDLN